MKIHKNKQKKKGSRLKVLLLLSIAFSASLMLVTGYGKGGLTKINRLQNELTQIKEEFHSLENDNNQIKIEIASLKNDNNYIEKIAREKLGMVKEGETVFIFLKNK